MSRILSQAACAALMAAAAAAAAETNPLARFGPAPDALANGRWNGVDLERRTQCSRPENEGSRGTYAQFDVVTDATGTFAITQSGVTGLNCNYTGRGQVAAGRLSASGTYSCTDGKQGSFQTTVVDVRETSLQIRMAIRLSGTETCAVDAILDMARFYP